MLCLCLQLGYTGTVPTSESCSRYVMVPDRVNVSDGDHDVAVYAPPSDDT